SCSNCFRFLSLSLIKATTSDLHKFTGCDLVNPTGFFWSTIFIEGYINFNEHRSGKGLLAKIYKHRTIEKLFYYLAISI
ncbi:hypothetical protein, partial [Francisella tularensis]|uniref:hypothetical protein n=1 Tax=Francisella tularensis TaxID=263 RepID=UPI002381AD24